MTERLEANTFQAAVAESAEAAMQLTKSYCVPVNAMRLDCKIPGRICNTWTITEKSFTKSRLKVMLINEDLGL